MKKIRPGKKTLATYKQITNQPSKQTQNTKSEATVWGHIVYSL